MATVELMAASGLPCFGRGKPVENLRARFRLDLTDAQVAICADRCQGATVLNPCRNIGLLRAVQYLAEWSLESCTLKLLHMCLWTGGGFHAETSAARIQQVDHGLLRLCAVRAKCHPEMTTLNSRQPLELRDVSLA
jgi:hypothetical protein